MSTRCILVTLGACLLLAGVETMAGEKTPPVPIQALVEQLGSARYAEREAAARALEARGGEALPILRLTVGRTADLEVRRRGERLLRQIEQKVETDRALAGKRIRLVYKDTPVVEAVEDFAQKTGFPIQLNGDLTGLANRTVTLDTGEMTFWQALAQFCDQAGLADWPLPVPKGQPFRAPRLPITVDDMPDVTMVHSRYYPGRNLAALPVLLRDAKMKRPPTYFAGAVRICALPGAGIPVEPGEAAIELQVLPQPKMPWQGITRLTLSRVVDEQGRPLTQVALDPNTDALAPGNVEVDPVTGEMIGVGLHRRFLPVRLKHGPQAPKVLKEVQGHVTVQLEVLKSLLRVDSVLEAAGKTIRADDGDTLKIVEVKREEGGGLRLRVQLDVSRPFAAGQAAHLVRVRPGVVVVRTASAGAVGPFALSDEQGRLWEQIEIRSTLRPGDGLRLVAEAQLVFRRRTGQGDAAMLMYSVPRPVLLDVPFRLRDVAVE